MYVTANGGSSGRSAVHPYCAYVGTAGPSYVMGSSRGAEGCRSGQTTQGTYVEPGGNLADFLTLPAKFLRYFLFLPAGQRQMGPIRPSVRPRRSEEGFRGGQVRFSGTPGKFDAGQAQEERGGKRGFLASVRTKIRV